MGAVVAGCARARMSCRSSRVNKAGLAMCTGSALVSPLFMKGRIDRACRYCGPCYLLFQVHISTLDSIRPLPSVIPEALTEIVTPLRWQAWDRKLAQHPNQRFRTYIVDGIKQGLCSARSNMSSSRQFPQIISQYLAEECAEGRIVGPLPRDFVNNVQVSRFGLIPKKSPSEWRLIVDLSSPEGRSVNDGVYEHLCSLKYVTVEDALLMVVACGRGTMLAKVDVQKEYRNVPINPADRPLLGMMWENNLYIDTALPFGLRSAPKIFTAVADAAEWIVHQEGVERVIHYLDDFLIIGPPHSTKCKQDVYHRYF